MNVCSGPEGDIPPPIRSLCRRGQEQFQGCSDQAPLWLRFRTNSNVTGCSNEKVIAMAMHATFEAFPIRARAAGSIRRGWLMLCEWQRRSRTREELHMLGERERNDLRFRREAHAEIRKSFWQS